MIPCDRGGCAYPMACEMAGRCRAIEFAQGLAKAPARHILRVIFSDDLTPERIDLTIKALEEARAGTRGPIPRQAMEKALRAFLEAI